MKGVRIKAISSGPCYRTIIYNSDNNDNTYVTLPDMSSHIYSLYKHCNTKFIKKIFNKEKSPYSSRCIIKLYRRNLDYYSHKGDEEDRHVARKS